MAPPTGTTSRFAFYGRVSTEDAQDPSPSIPRQLAACERALEPGGGEIVARYWDSESGRKALAERGAEAPTVGRASRGWSQRSARRGPATAAPSTR